MVELSHPWKNVVVQRKLPPLKYYYDLDMGESHHSPHIWASLFIQHSLPPHYVVMMREYTSTQTLVMYM